MTTNSAQKKAARAYQAEHPGTNYTTALRAVTRPANENLTTDERRARSKDAEK